MLLITHPTRTARHVVAEEVRSPQLRKHLLLEQHIAVPPQHRSAAGTYCFHLQFYLFSKLGGRLAIFAVKLTTLAPSLHTDKNTLRTKISYPTFDLHYTRPEVERNIIATPKEL